MANVCVYKMRVVGKDKSAIERLMSIMDYRDSQYYLYRVSSVSGGKIRSTSGRRPPQADDFWSAQFRGHVAWSCYHWVHDEPDPADKADNGAGYTNMPTVCKELNLAVEIWASEHLMGFQQHIIIDNKGNVVTDVEKDLPEKFPDYGRFSESVGSIWNNAGDSSTELKKTMRGKTATKSKAKGGVVKKVSKGNRQ